MKSVNIIHLLKLLGLLLFAIPGAIIGYKFAPDAPTYPTLPSEDERALIFYINVWLVLQYHL